MRSRFIIFILRLRDKNESSKLLTFSEVSDLNGLTNVHANPGRLKIINCAYDLSWIVFSIAFCFATKRFQGRKSKNRYFSSIFLIIFQKSYQLVSNCLLCSFVIGLDLEYHSHSREKVQFFETRLRIFFLALAWRDEIEIII